MAKYNIYGHVLYSEIEYERLMYTTERIFINALMNRIDSIKQWTDELWNNIDHEYMVTTLEEIKKDIIKNDYDSYLKFKNTSLDIEELFDDLEEILKQTDKIPDLYKINEISKFKTVEKSYGEHISKSYKKRLETIDEVDEVEYLTKQIKNFNKLEETIPYRDKNGLIVRRVNPSTYLSMLYNVNLTRTGWNQTFKDADYFEKDIMKLEYHPLSCPKCAPMQEKLYSISGKSNRYSSVEYAYQRGVGHPNCKCEWSIYWNKEQMRPLPYTKTTDDDYKIDQQKKAVERELRRAENDLNLYNMIGNGEMVDKTFMKIERLKNKLVS